MRDNIRFIYNFYTGTYFHLNMGGKSWGHRFFCASCPSLWGVSSISDNFLPFVSFMFYEHWLIAMYIWQYSQQIHRWHRWPLNCKIRWEHPLSILQGKMHGQNFKNGLKLCNYGPDYFYLLMRPHSNKVLLDDMRQISLQSEWAGLLSSSPGSCYDQHEVSAAPSDKWSGDVVEVWSVVM